MEPWGVHLGSVTWADLGIALWLSFTIDWLAQPYRLDQRFRAKWVLWLWREVDRHRGVGGQGVALVKWTPLVTAGCNCANISHTTQGFERDPFLETSVRWDITIQTGIREGWRPREPFPFLLSLLCSTHPWIAWPWEISGRRVSWMLCSLVIWGEMGKCVVQLLWLESGISKIG